VGCSCTQWPQEESKNDENFEKVGGEAQIDPEPEKAEDLKQAGKVTDEPKADLVQETKAPEPAEPEPEAPAAAPAPAAEEKAEAPAAAITTGMIPMGNPELQQQKLTEFLAGKATLGELSKTFVDVGDRRPSIDNISIDEYTKKHDADFQRLLDLNKDARWVYKKTAEGVVVHQFFDEKLGVAAVKGETEMDCGKHGGLKYILECLLDPANRPQYDETCCFGEMVEQRLPYYRVSYFQLLTPTPFISNRDVLLLGRLRFEEDGTLLIDLKQMDPSKKPLNPDFERIDWKAGGYIIRPTEKEGVLKVSFMACVDPNGWLPQWLKNLIAWKQSLVLAKFKSKYNL